MSKPNLDPAVRDLLVDIYLALGRPWSGDEERLPERAATVQVAVEWMVRWGDPSGVERAVEVADARRCRRADQLAAAPAVR
jgi:hypothetical protein